MSSFAVTNVGTPTFLSRFATISGVLLAIILLTNWPTYNYLILGGPPALLYYLLPGLVALAVAMADPPSAVRLFDERLLWWFTFYMISGLAWLLWSQDFLDVANRQWRLRVLGFYFFSAILLTASVAKRSTLAFAAVICVFIVSALNWFDVLFPLRLVAANMEGANPGRGAGMFINANAAAALVLMGTMAALPHVLMRFRAAVLLAAVVGIMPTFSRFGFIFVLLLIIIALLTKLLDHKQRFILLLTIPLLAAGGAFYHESLLQSANANQNILARLAWFETFGRELDFSARERADVAQRAWSAFLESPLVGHGVGATLAKGQRTGTHNMYLLLMAEQGLIGLALYFSLIGLIGRRGWRLARTASDAHGREIGLGMMLYAFFLALYGFVSHNVLEEPHGMFILAFIVAAARGAEPARYVSRVPG